MNFLVYSLCWRISVISIAGEIHRNFRPPDGISSKSVYNLQSYFWMSVPCKIVLITLYLDHFIADYREIAFFSSPLYIASSTKTSCQCYVRGNDSCNNWSRIEYRRCTIFYHNTYIARCTWHWHVSTHYLRLWVKKK